MPKVPLLFSFVNMKALKLRYYPDPILRQAAQNVTTFDEELAELAEAMIDTMYREKGIGLAAPQVGYSLRLAVALRMKDADDTQADALVIVNPRVLSTSSELWSYEEGCLSIPGVNAPVLRPVGVEVEYQDLDGEPHRIADDEVFGRILLHEIDHLNGRLFIDYLSSTQKSLIKSQLKKLVQSYPTP